MKRQSTHVIYEIIKEDLYCDDLGKYTSYGIVVKDNYGREIQRFSDISCKESEVVLLSKRCNDGALDPSQLCYVVEDFVIEASSKNG